MGGEEKDESQDSQQSPREFQRQKSLRTETKELWLANRAKRMAAKKASAGKGGKRKKKPKKPMKPEDLRKNLMKALNIGKKAGKQLKVVPKAPKVEENKVDPFEHMPEAVRHQLRSQDTFQSKVSSDPWVSSSSEKSD